MLLFKAKAKTWITALRKSQSASPSLLAGSLQLLQQRYSVSGGLPTEPTGLALSRLSIAKDEPSSPAHANDVGTPPEQDTSETK